MHPNEALIRVGYEAMARGEGRPLAALLTADTRWVICGHGRLAGTYTGPDEIFGLWKAIAAQTGGGLRLEVRDVIANDARAVVLATARGARGDRHLEERQVAIFEIDGSHVTEATFVYEDPEAYDRFWDD